MSLGSRGFRSSRILNEIEIKNEKQKLEIEKAELETVQKLLEEPRAKQT